MADPLIVACVLKSGGDFDTEYVERLWEGVRRHLKSPHHFVCLSDVDVPCDRIELKYDLPGWWSKMELFRPDISGDIFYIDLDTIIVGDLAPLADDMSVPKMMRGGVSSVMTLPQYCRASVWAEWIKNPSGHMERLGYNSEKRRSPGFFDNTNVGDQAFIRRLLRYSEYPASRLCWYGDLLAPTCYGPKVLNPKTAPDPRNVAAIVFNYRPRPRDVGWLENGLTVGQYRYGAA